MKIVTAAHHSSVDFYMPACNWAAQTPTCKLRYKESSMDTLWQEKEFEQICCRESLTGKKNMKENVINEFWPNNVRLAKKYEATRSMCRRR